MKCFSNLQRLLMYHFVFYYVVNKQTKWFLSSCVLCLKTYFNDSQRSMKGLLLTLLITNIKQTKHYYTNMVIKLCNASRACSQ